MERPSLELVEDPELQDLDLSRTRSGILGLVKWLGVIVVLSLRSDTLLPQESSPYIVADFLKVNARAAYQLSSNNDNNNQYL